jgi:hypothetical protein
VETTGRWRRVTCGHGTIGYEFEAFTHLSLINAALNLNQQPDLQQARSAA